MKTARPALGVRLYQLPATGKLRKEPGFEARIQGQHRWGGEEGGKGRGGENKNDSSHVFLRGSLHKITCTLPAFKEKLLSHRSIPSLKPQS